MRKMTKKLFDEIEPIRSTPDEDANKEFFKVEPGKHCLP